MRPVGKPFVALASAFALIGVGSVAGAQQSSDFDPGPPSDPGGVQPEALSDTPPVRCSDLQPDGVEWMELEVQLENRGDTISDDDGTLFVELQLSMQGDDFRTFDWQSNIDVDAVIVKGGPDANFYRYDPPSTGDGVLHAPVNPNNDKFFGLSNARFCYGEPDDDKDTTTTTTTTTEPPSEEPPSEEPPSEEPPDDDKDERDEDDERADLPEAKPAEPIVAEPSFVG